MLAEGLTYTETSRSQLAGASDHRRSVRIWGPLTELYTRHSTYNKQSKSGIEVQVRRDTGVRQVAGGNGKSDAQHCKND